MDLQPGALSEALCAMVTPVGRLPRVLMWVFRAELCLKRFMHCRASCIVGLLTDVSPQVDLQLGALSVALHALVTPVGLLTGVSPHVELQGACVSEALRALVPPEGLLPGVGKHVDNHLGIVGKNLDTQDTWPSLAASPRPRQLLTVDNPQLPVVKGHVGGARRVPTQTFRGGAALCAAVSNVIAVFFREENKDREKVMV